MWKYCLRLLFSVPIPAKVFFFSKFSIRLFFKAKNHGPFPSGWMVGPLIVLVVSLISSSNRGREKKTETWLFSQALPLFSHITDTHTRAYTFQNNHRICVLKQPMRRVRHDLMGHFNFLALAHRGKIVQIDIYYNFQSFFN